MDDISYSKKSSVGVSELFGRVIFNSLLSGIQQSGELHLFEQSIHGNFGLNDVKK